MNGLKNVLSENVIACLEKNRWDVCGTYKEGQDYYTELETYSPLGEDFIFTVWHNGTSKGFINAFGRESFNFDVDEHIEILIPYRGKNGVPGSIRALVEDAEDIQAILSQTARDLWELLEE